MLLGKQLVSNNIGERFDLGLVDYKVRYYVIMIMVVTIITSIFKKILLSQRPPLPLPAFREPSISRTPSLSISPSSCPFSSIPIRSSFMLFASLESRH